MLVTILILQVVILVVCVAIGGKLNAIRELLHIILNETCGFDLPFDRRKLDD